MHTHKPREYKHIRAWGNYLMSFTDYITAQQELASYEDAPINAIYKDWDTGEWATADQVTNPNAAEFLRLAVPL